MRRYGVREYHLRVSLTVPHERASAFLSEVWIRQDPRRTASARHVAHGKAHLVDVSLAASFRRLGMGCAIFDIINSRVTGAKVPQGVRRPDSERSIPWQRSAVGTHIRGECGIMDPSLIIEATDVILRPYRVDDADAIYDLTQEAAVVEFLTDWNVSKSQRPEWLVHYEIPENQQFIAAVAAGGHIDVLRLRPVIMVCATGKFVGWCCTGIKEELPPPNRRWSTRWRNGSETRGMRPKLFGPWSTIC